MTMRFLPVLLTGLALCPVACSGGADRAEVGARVPPFALTTSTGERVTDKTLEGHFVLLNFWSTSCGPCVKEVPALCALEESRRVTVVGIALDEEGWQTVRPFLGRHNVTYRVALGDEELFRRFDGVGIPHSVLLDRSLRVIKVYRGPVTQEMLEKDLRAVGGAEIETGG
jgi:cytochrome c biogenesis protein CcmG/thiol:disulfide interchange protein DsbE